MLISWASQYFDRWVTKSIPASAKVALHRKNLFILPTQRGVFFLVIASVIWLLGTNYQNNLVLFVAYFMFALFVITIHQTFNNLSRVNIAFSHAQPVYAGESLAFRFSFHNETFRFRQRIYFYWCNANPSPGNDPIEVKSFLDTLGDDETKEISVPYRTSHRGKCLPGRLCVESVYPFGLLRCWSRIDVNAHALVYPQPIEASMLQLGANTDNESSQHYKQGGDEFAGMREYVQGDEIKRISWRASSKGKGLMVKEYVQYVSHDVWLNLSQVDAPTKELQLCALSYWANDFQKKNIDYGLVLDEVKIDPALGDNHFNRVMESLALYPSLSARKG